MHPHLDSLDWTQEGDACVALLTDLLRCDTSNPPGGEREAAELVAGNLRDAGVEPTVLESAPGRANVVARLPATVADPEPPLLLNAHLDVVPADAAAWTHPPFAGEVHDGWLWGRGAIDMKHMAAMSLRTLRLLATAGVPRRRDVLFAGVADEEAGCTYGSAWLVDHHRDRVAAGYALGEVGGFTLHVGDVPIYPVQVAEKGVLWVRATARGPAAHGSMPRADNAVVALAEFLAAVGRTPLRLRPSEPARRFLADLGSAIGPAAHGVLTALGTPGLSRFASRLVPDPATARTLQAVLRNTASPTMTAAGGKVNVIPPVAEAHLDGRIAVGSSAEELLDELRELAGPEIELDVERHRTPYAANPDTPLFALIGQVVAAHHPGAVAVPSVTPGFTDAHYFAEAGATCYGFAPVRLEPGGPAFAELFHATDERIPVAGVHTGIRMLADLVFRFVASTGGEPEPPVSAERPIRSLT